MLCFDAPLLERHWGVVNARAERNTRYVFVYLNHYSFRPFPERLVGRGPLGGRPMVIYVQGTSGLRRGALCIPLKVVGDRWLIRLKWLVNNSVRYTVQTRLDLGIPPQLRLNHCDGFTVVLYSLVSGQAAEPLSDGIRRHCTYILFYVPIIFIFENGSFMIEMEAISSVSQSSVCLHCVSIA